MQQPTSSAVGKVLFVIDGVAERETARMLNTALASRLDFPCYVQVVANYVLAFDLAIQQDIDVIVLPRENRLGDITKEEFIEMTTNVHDFSTTLLHTVDQDFIDHGTGATIRSTESTSCMVGDLISAINLAVGGSQDHLEHTGEFVSSIVPKLQARKRPREDSPTLLSPGYFEPSSCQQYIAHIHVCALPPMISAEEVPSCPWQGQLYHHSHTAQALVRAQNQSPVSSKGHPCRCSSLTLPCCHQQGNAESNNSSSSVAETEADAMNIVVADSEEGAGDSATFTAAAAAEVATDFDFNAILGTDLWM